MDAERLAAGVLDVLRSAVVVGGGRLSRLEEEVEWGRAIGVGGATSRVMGVLSSPLEVFGDGGRGWE